MKGSSLNFDPLVIHQLEQFVCADRMCELTGLVCGSRFRRCYGNDLICYQLSVVVKFYTEVVRILRRIHIVFVRIQLGVFNILCVLLVKGNINIMVNAIILSFGECRRHDVRVVIRAVNLGRCRIKILRQVTALGAADGILIIEYCAGDLVLYKIRTKGIRSRHHLR